ncbi:MAG TPA: hypothetical protein PLC98_15145 [Anaerolineales bacterium]|nr:hypothetical protein [Anaerolineales bacterium]
MPMPIQRRVLMIVHNPTVPAAGGRTLTAALGWNDPGMLAERYCADVAECSHGLADFRVVERIDVDGFPVKLDGFAYTPDDYLRNWQRRTGWHRPDGVDYLRLIAEFDLTARIASGAIDEVWLFGGPYFGYYESIMGGPGAVVCNAPPLRGAEAAGRRFVIMGFNYERGVGEMLEDLGHRAESILSHAYRHTADADNLWERFTRHERTHPGQAECGTVHFAPNSERDYDWGNPRPVVSRSRAWLRFPDLEATARREACAEWGNGDIRRHHLWWLSRFPHIDGASGGVAWNWWEPVVDPERLR